MHKRQPLLILIRSPTGKSGTNFLLNILVALNAARLPLVDPLRREDHFLARADLLLEYSVETAAKWTKWPELEKRYSDGNEILRALGTGLEALAGVGCLPAVVLKTPSCENLEVGWRLFPSALHLVVVRDGRDVVESGYQAGYWPSRSGAAKAWTDAVANLRAGLERVSDRGRPTTLIVRYEELVRDVGAAIIPVVDALGHPACPEDTSRLADLPVYGSTDYGLRPDGTFEWRIASRKADFSPIGRWRAWSPTLTANLTEIMERELCWLGYKNG